MIKLEDLINNPKLAGLLRNDAGLCAVQLWILSNRESTKTRVLYGRLVPHNFKSDEWRFSNNNKFKKVGKNSYRITCLNLYTTVEKAKEFLTLYCNGRSLAEINKKLGFGSNPELTIGFSNLKLIPGNLIYQPPEYLLNKASNSKCLTSPLENTGAISAAIIQADKLDLFLQEPENAEFYIYITNHLNQATGLNFHSKDKERIGIIELLSFPSLDEEERQLLCVNINRNKGIATVSLPRTDKIQNQVQFVLKLYNLNKLIYSVIKLAKLTSNDVYTACFAIDNITLEIYDAAEAEVYHGKQEQLQLYDRWLMGFIREITFNSHILGAQVQPTTFNWLEKTINKKQESRAAAVLTPISTSRDSNTINGRKLDTWVDLNSQFIEKTNQLFPQASNGEFFLRWGQSEGEGRLQFVEWFKKHFQNYSQHHLAIFDPYFDLAGLEMLSLYGVNTTEYSVFTTEKKDVNKQDRFANLLSKCNKNSSQLSKLNFELYVMPEGALHDRYILIIDKFGTPVQGFHLSNSLQSVAEDHPLLITPIPQDVLIKVVDYIQSLMSDKTLLAFDSKQQINKQVCRIYEQAESISKDEFQQWLDALTEKVDFTKGWQKIAAQLASTSDVSTLIQEIDPPAIFIKQLENFFVRELNAEYEQSEQNIRLISPSFYASKLDGLLHLHLHQVGFEYYSKGSLLTWTDYYTIYFLWELNSEILLSSVSSAGKGVSPSKLDSKNIKKYALLNQILGNIYLQIELQPSLQFAQRLLATESELLQWLGLQAIKQEILTATSIDAFISLLARFTEQNQIKILGWLLIEAKRQDLDEAFKLIRAELFKHLPKNINDSQLASLINVLRGHMHSLVWNGEWIYEELLISLLKDEVITTEQVVQIWFAELQKLLPLSKEANIKLFEADKEGVLLNRTAFIFASSSENMQSQLVESIKKIINKQQRIIRQPLAQTSNWSQWDDAIHTAKWLECLVLLIQIYQKQHKKEPYKELVILLEELSYIANLRTQEEWHKYRGELMEFYEKIIELGI